METHIDITSIPEMIDSKTREKVLQESAGIMESSKDLFRLPYPVTVFRIKGIPIDTTALELIKDNVKQITYSAIISAENYFAMTFTFKDDDPVKISWHISKDGELIDGYEERFNMWELFLASIYATVLLNCKNVTLVTEPQAGLKQMLNRHINKKKVVYKILQINPLKPKTKQEYESIETGIKRSLHTCRGHLRTYTEDKKLFGKFIGTYFIPAHIRGSEEFGKVIKDYEILTTQ